MSIVYESDWSIVITNFRGLRALNNVKWEGSRHDCHPFSDGWEECWYRGRQIWKLVTPDGLVRYDSLGEFGILGLRSSVVKVLDRRDQLPLGPHAD